MGKTTIINDELLLKYADGFLDPKTHAEVANTIQYDQKTKEIVLKLQNSKLLLDLLAKTSKNVFKRKINENY